MTVTEHGDMNHFADDTIRVGEMGFKVVGPLKNIKTLKNIVGHHGWPTRKIFEF